MRRQVTVLWRVVLGTALGLFAKLWLATLRLEVVAHPALRQAAGRRWVFAFFHGTQWPLLAWRGRRPLVALVSLSLDGVMQARALATLGLLVERGSSSRGGARGLARVVRRLKSGGVDAAFAVDGPRGPRGVVKGGARVAARASGGLLVPVGSAFERGFTLKRAWDHYGVAAPFSRAAIYLGAPIEPDAGDPDLGLAIMRANDHAARLLGHGLVRSGAAGVTK